MGRAWSPDEVARLVSAMADQPEDVSWVIVARQVGTRTARMCRGKWLWEMGECRRLPRRIWSEYEDQTLWQMREDGATWTEVAVRLRTRCLNEVRDHYKTLVQRSRKTVKKLTEEATEMPEICGLPLLDDQDFGWGDNDDGWGW
jgi:hypothetical protein